MAVPAPHCAVPSDMGNAGQTVDSNKPLSVLFYGTFLPLHGMDVLLHACKLLEGKAIEFRIIGGTGKALARFQSLLNDLNPGNVVHDTWVDFEDLQSTVIPFVDHRNCLLVEQGTSENLAAAFEWADRKSVV